MKKKAWRRISVVQLWTISYVVIFIIPTIVSLLIYTTGANMIRGQMRSAGRLTLQSVRSQMDAEIVKVMSDSFGVAYQNDFRWLNEVSSFAEADAYRLKLAVASLRDAELMKESVDGILFYFRNSGIAVSNTSTQDIQRYFDYYYSEFPDFKQEWLDLVQGNYEGDGGFRRIDLQGSSHNRVEVYYIKSIYPGDEPSGYNVIMQLSQRTLSSIFGSTTTYNGATLALLDRSGQTIYASSGGAEPDRGLRESMTRSPEGFHETHVEGIPSVAIHLESQAFPATYLLVVPQETFYNQLVATWYMVVAIGLLALTVGVLVIALMVRLNYNPLRRVLTMLRKEPVQDIDKGNEYDLIEQAIGTLSTQKNEADMRIYQQERELRNILINRLLHGTEQFGLSTWDLMESYHLKFEGHFFAVISIMVDDANEEIFLAENEKEMGSQYRLQVAEKRMQFVAANVMEELLGKSYACYVTTTDGMTSCLLNLPDNDVEKYRMIVNDAARQLIELARNHYDGIVSVAASDIIGGVSGIPTAYDQIGYTLEYGQNLNDTQAVFYTDVRGMSPGLYYYPPTVERQLVRLIEKGETKEAASLIDEVFHRNTTASVGETGGYAIGVDMAKLLAANIVGTLFKAMDFSDRDNPSELGMVLKGAGQLQSCKSIEDLRQKLDETVARYISLLEAGKQDADIRQSNGLCGAIEQYVQGNYADTGLSITTLAGHLGVNPAYCSRSMRRVRGIGLLDYINSYRVEKAKEIIAAREDATVEEIAREVGFATAKTLTRCFKKYTGTTPGKFKADLQESCDRM